MVRHSALASPPWPSGWPPTPGRPPRSDDAPPAFVPMFALASAVTAASAPSSSDSLRNGASGMLEPRTGSLLIQYYETFLRDQDIEEFRRHVSARYTAGTLARLVESGPMQARRAAVLSLGLFGGLENNATLARALRDDDATVRSLADNALWAIWLRADTPENNATLERVRDLIGHRLLDQAIELATRLVERAPGFAEAYNQRAIAHYFWGHFEESVADCRRVLHLNPYHFGALSGLAKCQLRLGQRQEALETFRRALKLQPHSEGLRKVVAALEAEGE